MLVSILVCKSSCQDLCCSDWIIVSFSSSPLNQSTVIQLNVTYSSKQNYSSVITLPEQVPHATELCYILQLQ